VAVEDTTKSGKEANFNLPVTSPISRSTATFAVAASI
jgi:hypothetical protein